VSKWSPGLQLGPYELTSPIGKGGLGRFGRRAIRASTAASPLSPSSGGDPHAPSACHQFLILNTMSPMRLRLNLGRNIQSTRVDG